MEIINLDKLLGQWSERWAREHGAKANPDTGKFATAVSYKGGIVKASHKLSDPRNHVVITQKNTTYSDLQSTKTEEVLASHSAISTNETGSENKETISREFTYTETTTKTITHGIIAHIGFSVEASVLDILKISAELWAEINKTDEAQTTRSEEKKITMTKEITLATYTKTSTDLLVKRQNTTIDFAGENHLTGRVIIACHTQIKCDIPQYNKQGSLAKVKGAHKKWSVPIAQVFADCIEWQLIARDAVRIAEDGTVICPIRGSITVGGHYFDSNISCEKLPGHEEAGGAAPEASAQEHSVSKDRTVVVAGGAKVTGNVTSRNVAGQSTSVSYPEGMSATDILNLQRLMQTQQPERPDQIRNSETIVVDKDAEVKGHVSHVSVGDERVFNVKPRAPAQGFFDENKAPGKASAISVDGSNNHTPESDGNDAGGYQHK